MAFSKIKTIDLKNMNTFTNSMGVGAMYTIMSENKRRSIFFKYFFKLLRFH